MTDQCHGLLALLHYWQDLAAGILATVAAFITIGVTWAIAQRQIKASLDQVSVMKEQIEDLRATRKKEAAIETLKAGRLFLGIIANLVELKQNGREVKMIIGIERAFQIPALPDLPLADVFQSLAVLDPEIIKKYFELSALVAVYRAKAPPAAKLQLTQSELGVLDALTSFLKGEIQELISRQECILRDSPPTATASQR